LAEVPTKRFLNRIGLRLVNDNPFATLPDAGIDFVLPLSRPGSFVLWVRATDRITKRSTEFETTFNV
jgi:hypothetical protein